MLSKPAIDTAQIDQRGCHDVMIRTIFTFVYGKGPLKQLFLLVNIAQAIVRIAKVGKRSRHITVIWSKFTLLNFKGFLQMLSLFKSVPTKPIRHTQVVQSCSNHGVFLAITGLQLTQRHSAQSHSCWSFVVVLAGWTGQVQQEPSRSKGSFNAVDMDILGRATADAWAQEFAPLLQADPASLARRYLRRIRRELWNSRAHLCQCR
mmetsp:Transcript_33147/g.79332  ORF Transcript_33147/g.79332 Transcript_33147/m.79332 type:complete len:205 (+) Transcript_33147:1036-1650(+)